MCAAHSAKLRQSKPPLNPGFPGSSRRVVTSPKDDTSSKLPLSSCAPSASLLFRSSSIGRCWKDTLLPNYPVSYVCKGILFQLETGFPRPSTFPSFLFRPGVPGPCQCAQPPPAGQATPLLSCSILGPSVARAPEPASFHRETHTRKAGKSSARGKFLQKRDFMLGLGQGGGRDWKREEGLYSLGLVPDRC